MCFGVKGGTFLGFMLTYRGIEANLNKCQAIVEMRSPKNIKEIQKLFGKLTAMSRFIPKLAEKIGRSLDYSRRRTSLNGAKNVRSCSQC